MGYYILMAVTVIFFIVLHAVIFPHIFFRLRGTISSRDRGIRDIAEEDGGRTIIYEPEEAYRKYLKHYILSERDGEKQVICEVSGDIRYIDYDVRMFNGDGQAFRILNVKQIMDGGSYTETVAVDDDTAYVSVAINEVDDKKFIRKNERSRLSGFSLAIYFLLCLVTDVLAVFLLKVSVAEVFGGVFHESFMYSAAGNAVTIAVCAAVVIADIAVTLIILKKAAIKKVSGR